MTERDQIYVAILRFGLFAIRDKAMSGNVKYCEIEAEHLHNLPSLIGESNEHRHAYYVDAERPFYLERVDRSTPGIDFTLARYEDLWRQLEKSRKPIETVNEAQ